MHLDLALFRLTWMVWMALGSTIAVGGEPFRVMTWNLEWFYDENSGDNYSELSREQSAPTRADWNWKRDGIAAAIASVRPDVVATQEVENRRVMWYLTRSITKNFSVDYEALSIEGRDYFTEQDVGFLLRRDTVDYAAQTIFNLSRAQRDDAELMDLTKHMVVTIEATDGAGHGETITLLNLHLRATEKATSLRERQSRLMHRWIAPMLAAGDNVIVLGDFNTELRGRPATASDDLGIAMGLDTPGVEDDLIDLTARLPIGQRQTHVLPGRQFDRILVSPSLINNDSNKLDLVFENIRVAPELTIRGAADTPEDHWENYWQRDASERDLSDHYPVIADFVWK